MKRGRKVLSGQKENNTSSKTATLSYLSSTCRGFTLIELLIVISIIGIVFSSIVPTALRYKDTIKFNYQIERTYFIIVHAKQTAISTHTATKVIFPGRTFEFAPSGATMVGGSGTLILKSPRGRSVSIIVSSEGRIRVQR